MTLSENTIFFKDIMPGFDPFDDDNFLSFSPENDKVLSSNDDALKNYEQIIEPEADNDYKNHSLDDLKKYMHLSLKDAAIKLKCCTTSLKHSCRTLGIIRWPQRRISAAARYEKCSPNIFYTTYPDKFNSILQNFINSDVDQPTKQDITKKHKIHKVDNPIKQDITKKQKIHKVDNPIKQDITTTQTTPNNQKVIVDYNDISDVLLNYMNSLYDEVNYLYNSIETNLKKKDEIKTIHQIETEKRIEKIIEYCKRNGKIAILL